MTKAKINFETIQRFHIDHINKTITMPKDIYKKASVYKSEEYNALIELKNAFPTFDIKVKETRRTTSRKDHLKGLTYAYMENFINLNGTDEQREYFKLLRNPSTDGLKTDRISYGSIKKWFVEEFPQILDYQNKIDQILSHKTAC